MGVSPILPTILLTNPPVEVAAAKFPFLSTATHPTVPIWLSSLPVGLSLFSSF
ncbi:hypothetical protein OIU74_023879 [Salix koriyanagi]|uniref:Uncharacterized protein n=1 Tax=Salix koriyanagi TaxID=2511006 RepID=A0A9Q0WEQ9_9ROSI|nr:hypothetical protein OIU74_023879 [Salix koriyanagi]